MKIYSLWLVVMAAAIFSTLAMERPPLSDSQLLTPVKQTKRKLFHLSREVIRGHPKPKQEEENIDPAVGEENPEKIDPALKDGSPKKFYEDLRALHDRTFAEELRKKGVSPTKIDARWDDAEQFIEEENATLSTFRLSATLEAECRAIARKLGVANIEFRGARLDNPAECRGRLVLIDPQYLYEEATTQEARAVIITHEIFHSIHGDHQRNIATSMACDVAGVSLSPGFNGKRSRADEFFADLGMATSDRALAHANQEHCRKNRRVYGDGVSSSHHSDKDREREAELAHTLLQVHEAKKQRNIKRDLRKEFEDAWGD